MADDAAKEDLKRRAERKRNSREQFHMSPNGGTQCAMLQRTRRVNVEKKSLFLAIRRS